ncbi:UXP [Simian adenovirus 19]|uniref:UXP n=1 Tax=Simian adenovirus 19 TaxID=38416 RepID=A0A0M3TH19_9ADEN|nr:UXP [Simian adenovirus 19]ALE30436.1 UXP [Simian adenovirus 19]
MKKMRIVCEEKQVDTSVSFRIWRKYAAHRHIPYESWEEGEVVKPKKFDKKLLADLRAFAARVSSRPNPSKILGTSSKEAISGVNHGRQSEPGRAFYHPLSAGKKPGEGDGSPPSQEKGSQKLAGSSAVAGNHLRQRRRRHSSRRRVQLPSGAHCETSRRRARVSKNDGGRSRPWERAFVCTRGKPRELSVGNGVGKGHGSYDDTHGKVSRSQ